MQKNSNYLCLCYHYIRSKQLKEKFPRILGISKSDFNNHLEMVKNNFTVISESQLLQLVNGNFTFDNEKLGMLFTFDDGLLDHYYASKILFDHGIKAIFFVPTCILEDHLPANPIIIHYGIAIFGIERFLEIYHEGLVHTHLDYEKFYVDFTKGEDDVWSTINTIKNIFKYNLNNKDSRNLLLYIYEHLILNKFPNALDFMHLNSDQIKEMLEMGHSIGVHTHSHISIGSNNLSKNDFITEMIKPKRILEHNFNTKIFSLSYPFGDKKDCLTSMELIKQTSEYELAFTVENKINYNITNRLEIGRYQPTSTESSQSLLKTLNQIF